MYKAILRLSVISGALLLLSGCSENSSEFEALVDYESEDGSYIKLTTGEGAVEEASERFYHNSSTLTEEEKRKELLLIEELGGFENYNSFIDTAEKVELSDMYEKHGLNPQRVIPSDSDPKKKLVDSDSSYGPADSGLFCDWFGAGCDDDDGDDGPREITSSNIQACPDRFTGSAAGRRHYLYNKYGTLTRVEIGNHGLPVSAKTTALKGKKLKTTPRSSSCHTAMRKIFDRSKYYRDRFNSSDYEVGHLIPARLGGYQLRANLTLQRTYINQSIVKIIEGAVAQCNDSGGIKSSGSEYSVSVGYALNGDLTVPSSYSWKAIINTNTGTVGNGRKFTVDGRIYGNISGNISSAYRTQVVAASAQLKSMCAKKRALPPPSAVNVTAQSAAAILITWTAVQEAEKYNVFIKNGANYKYLTTTRNNRFTATGLSGGRSYSFIVTTIGRDGLQSSRSREATARTFANTNQRLSPPSNVQAKALSSSSVRVSWNTADQAVKYNVFQKAKDSNYFQYKTTVSSTNSVVIRGLSEDVHKFAVTAIDGSGRQSARSSVATADCTCVKKVDTAGLSVGPGSDD